MPRKARKDHPPISESDAAFGRRLAQLRKERGLTQTELGEMADVSQEFVSRYERGVVRLHAAMVVRFAKALDVTTDELLGVQPANDRADPVAPKLRRRMERIGSLEPTVQRALIKTIDIFLETKER